MARRVRLATPRRRGVRARAPRVRRRTARRGRTRIATFTTPRMIG